MRQLLGILTGVVLVTQALAQTKKIHIWHNTRVNNEEVTLTAYEPERPNGMAVIICPGGSYFWLSLGTEGHDVAMRLKDEGYTAFVLNYRTGGVDIFAGVNYGTRNFLQLSDAEKETTGSPVFKDQATIDAAETDRNLGGNAGINWQIADNHFMGGKVEWGRELSVSGRTIIHDKVTRDGELMDDITTITEDTLGEKAPFNVGTNFYYNGTVG